MKFYSLAFLSLAFSVTSLFADGPTDNLPEKVRRIPPPGAAIPAEERKELEQGLSELRQTIESLRTELQSKPALLALLPDVQIFHNAVHNAVDFDEFYSITNEVPAARAMLRQGLDRANQLRAGKASWTTATGLIVRGYVSKIDGSAQPYGLVVPASYEPGKAHPFRLDTWFHGRGETLSELNFLRDRQRSPGEFAPPNAFVLHPYGRYCNGQKFAGETDFFEALSHVREHYPIDENRITVRGFSLGGAACWHLAVHYAGLWAASAPGAGFAETADFLRVFQNEPLNPPWYEQKLWHLYDCTDYALNLFNCPTVAYSGEIDKQKQAADIMAKAMASEGLKLLHIIGPQTAHRYHPDSKIEINERMDRVVASGRNPLPLKIRFTTWTLRYNEMLWMAVDGLEEHWERARVEAEILDANTIGVRTENVSALTLSMPPGLCPLDNTRPPRVVLDGRELQAAPVLSDRSWTASFRKDARKWAAASSSGDGILRKRHGLQGPIDDAFMDSFIMVLPSGSPLNERIGAWTAAEQSHAIEHWRRQFRGEARVKQDTEITDAEIKSTNLILWGDPSSNKLLARIVDQIPIRWDSRGIQVGKETYSPDHHVPVLIYPNPLNPNRYVVLNSGFTFREYDYLNNARQVPKLPDFAIVDISVPVSSRAPGGIVNAGFFGERWELLERTN